MFQNLRRVLPEGAPESVHFCDIPEAEAEQVCGCGRHWGRVGEGANGCRQFCQAQPDP